MRKREVGERVRSDRAKRVARASFLVITHKPPHLVANEGFSEREGRFIAAKKQRTIERREE
jgi:hypothetical protein